MMTAEELAFIAAICAEPAEDTPRLVYADYLDGLDTASVECPACGGDGLARLPSHHRGCGSCSGTGYTTDTRHRDRAEFIRVQVALSRPISCKGWGCRLCTSPAVVQPSFSVEDCGCTQKRKQEELRRRERELLNAPCHGTYGVSNWGLWAKDVLDRFPSRSGVYSTNFPVQFSRGFVSHVTCTAADWLAHCDQLYWHPGQTVECPWCKGTKLFHFESAGVAKTDSCMRCEKTPGHIPRPCPPTAHPIERVTLSESPQMSGYEWPITFELPKDLMLLNSIQAFPNDSGYLVGGGN